MVNAVVPLRKESISGWFLSSWSMAAYVFKKDCFHISNRKRFRSLSISKSMSSGVEEKVVSCQLHSKEAGSDFLTLLLTK